MRTLISLLSAIILLVALPSIAGDLEDGIMARSAGDYQKALSLLMPLAERGEAEAQYPLGGMYRHGQGVPKDLVQAFFWYQLAAEQGKQEAQQRLGEMYKAGQGVARDEEKAKFWLQKAAECRC